MNVTNVTTRATTSTSTASTGTPDPEMLLKLDDILRRLKVGHKSAISDLKALGIRYTLQEQQNRDYIVNFYYLGQRYNVFFDFDNPEKSKAKNPYAGYTPPTDTTQTGHTTETTEGTRTTEDTDTKGTTEGDNTGTTSDTKVIKEGLVPVTDFLDRLELVDDLKEEPGVEGAQDAPTSPESPSEPEPNEKPTINNEALAQSATLVQHAIENVVEEKIDNIADGNKNIHTEFGIDKNGNIVFQEENTQKVFDNLVNQVIKTIKSLEMFGRYQNILQNLGGEDVLKQLIQTAWITTYNTFDSSKSNNTEDFVKEVLKNLDKIMQKLETNPEMLSMFTQRTSYADSSITEGVTHYGTKTTTGGDEKINYKGNIVVYDDGSVHIANDKDDNDYQTTMNEVLANLIEKYSNVDSEIITNLFREAQKATLEAIQGNKSDCPYGTANNDGRVEDTERDWRGKNNRSDDKHNIDMDQLVQLTLYYFDKLLYQNLLN